MAIVSHSLIHRVPPVLEPEYPRVINTDKDAAYPPAIVQLKAEGALEENRQHIDRCNISITYWNRITGAIKRRINASQYFRFFLGSLAHITPFAQEKVDGSTLLIDGAIEVDQLAAHSDCE